MKILPDVFLLLRGYIPEFELRVDKQDFWFGAGVLEEVENDAAKCNSYLTFATSLMTDVISKEDAE